MNIANRSYKLEMKILTLQNILCCDIPSSLYHQEYILFYCLHVLDDEESKAMY